MIKNIVFALLLGSSGMLIGMAEQKNEKGWLKHKQPAVPLLTEQKAEQIFFSQMPVEEKIKTLGAFDCRSSFSNLIPALKVSASPEKAIIKTIKATIRQPGNRVSKNEIIDFCSGLIKKNKEDYAITEKKCKVNTLWIGKKAVAWTTYFHYAVQENNIEWLELLFSISPNISIDIFDCTNKTLLSYAKSEKMIKYLLEKGADWRLKDGVNHNALQNIALKYDIKIFEFALMCVTISQEELKELRSFFEGIAVNTATAQSSYGKANHKIVEEYIALIASYIK